MEPPSLAVLARRGAPEASFPPPPPPWPHSPSLSHPESARRTTREPHPLARPEHSPESAPYRQPARPRPEPRPRPRALRALRTLPPASAGASRELTRLLQQQLTLCLVRPLPATQAWGRMSRLDRIRWPPAKTKKQKNKKTNKKKKPTRGVLQLIGVRDRVEGSCPKFYPISTVG